MINLKKLSLIGIALEIIIFLVAYAISILAYLMILLYPIFFERLKNKKAIHAIYFLYVGFVMAMTYIARMNGEFEGASPELFHKVALGLVVGAMAILSTGSLFFPYPRIRKDQSTTRHSSPISKWPVSY